LFSVSKPPLVSLRRAFLACTLVALIAGGSPPAFAEGSDAPGMPRPEMHESYELSALGLIRIERPGSTKSFWRVFRGARRESVDQERFYELIGRPDLVEEQHSQNTLAAGLQWGGIGVIAGGAVLVLAGLTRSQTSTPLIAAGVGVVAAGYVLNVSGNHVAGPVITQAEAADAIERYNEALRARFGLTPGTTTAGRTRSPGAAEWRVAPWVAGSAGGAVVAASW